MCAYFREHKGFTLVEVLASMMLLTVVVIAMVALATQSSVFSRRIDTVYNSTVLAQRRIDVLQRLEFEQITQQLVGESSVRVDVDGNIDAGGFYLRTTQVTSDHDSNSHLKKIKVTVSRARISQKGEVDLAQTSGQPIVMETLLSDIE